MVNKLCKEMLHLRIIMLVLVALLSHVMAHAQKPDADRLLQQALEETRLGNYDRAFNLSRKGLEISPGYLDLQLLLARLYKLNGDTAAALNHYNVIINEHPENNEAAFGKATVLEMQGAYGNAFRIYKDLSLKAPSDSTYMLKQLGILDLWEQYDEAVSMSDKLSAAYPFNPRFKELNSYFSNALVAKYIKGGDTASVRRHYETILTREPGNETALSGMAKLFEIMHQYDPALSIYKKLSVWHPQDTTYVLRQLGVIELQKQYTEGVQDSISPEVRLRSAQIDLDKLLVQTRKNINHGNYKRAIEQASLGTKLCPHYLDFYLFLGRAYQMDRQRDSARYWFHYIIGQDNSYVAPYTYLINMEIEDKNYTTAEQLVDSAMVTHLYAWDFEQKKVAILELQQDYPRTYQYLKFLQEKYPDSSEIRKHLLWIERRVKTDRIGANYTGTFIDKDNLGSRHFGTIQYIGERQWGSFIPSINYVARMKDGLVQADGLQIELESYVNTGRRNYGMVNIAHSLNKAVFPDWRFAGSFFHNFRSGWEPELGFRYVMTSNADFATVVTGLSKYAGSWWLNIRGFFLNQDSGCYPSFTFTGRRYFNTRFDYLTLLAGYGTTPDDRSVQGLIGQRFFLKSYRVGAGYNKLWGDHIITGIQLQYNNQEFPDRSYYNEFEIFLNLQYKF